MDGGSNQEVGMRFQNITVPQGALVTDAYIEFTTDETNTDATDLIFYGEDTDNAIQFSSTNGDITARIKTTASVNWNSVPAWNIIAEVHQTPDLTPIVQEIINRSGWANGNAMVMIVDGTGERTAEAYDGSPTEAPQLVITYGTGNLSETACLDISTELAPYLDNIPKDPQSGTDGNTHYAIQAKTQGAIEVMSCHEEANLEIRSIQ